MCFRGLGAAEASSPLSLHPRRISTDPEISQQGPRIWLQTHTMPYNLRSGTATVAKRPDESSLPPRKRPRKEAKRPQVPSDCGDILRKHVARPLGPFETLFNAYPVVQAIVQDLSTPDVMALCITTPHLWRLLAANRAFHVFSNHRNCVDLSKPVGTLGEYHSRNTFERFFAAEEELRRLWCRYLDVGAITHLVLDGTEVTFELLSMVAAKANITLLSLKYCRKLSLEGINALLDHPPPRHQNSLEDPPRLKPTDSGGGGGVLLDLKTLRIWGVPKTQWIYVPSGYQVNGSLDDAITFADIRRHCQKKHIDLDVSHCRSPGICVGFQNAMVKWDMNSSSSFFKDQPISDESVWMCEKKRLQCRCGEIKELTICEDCIDDSYTEMYGFCETCKQFVCERCEGVWPLCDDCGPQCWDCSLSKWHETCTSCGDDICMSHAPNIRRVQQTCTLCDARFCDTCFFGHDHCIIEKCAVCYKMVCDDCLIADPICERCTLCVCKECIRAIDDSVGRENAFAPNARAVFEQYGRESSPSMGWCEGKWLCEECLGSIRSRLSLRRSVRSGDRRRSFVWLDKAPSLS